MLLPPAGIREILQQPPPGFLSIRAHVPGKQQDPATTFINRDPQYSSSVSCIAP